MPPTETESIRAPGLILVIRVGLENDARPGSARELAAMFRDNFTKVAADDSIVAGDPRV